MISFVTFWVCCGVISSGFVSHGCPSINYHRLLKAFNPLVCDKSPATPMGQLPVLRVKDKGLEICQTSAIATYLAKQCGFYGKTPEDAAMIDMVFEKYKELFDHLASASFAKTEEEKKDLVEKFVAKLPQLENFVAKRKKKGDKFIVNNELGLADLVVFNLMDNEKNIPGRDAYPRPATLDAIYTEVGKNPVIQQYVAKRKETPF